MTADKLRESLQKSQRSHETHANNFKDLKHRMDEEMKVGNGREGFSEVTQSMNMEEGIWRGQVGQSLAQSQMSANMNNHTYTGNTEEQRVHLHGYGDGPYQMPQQMKQVRFSQEVLRPKEYLENNSSHYNQQNMKIED